MVEHDDRTDRTRGMNTWRAGCGGSRTSGSEGGPEKPTTPKGWQGAPVRPLRTVTRFRCVDDQRAAGFPVSAACEAAGVSTSGFYDWQAREAAGPTEREVAEAELVELMREIFDASDGNYGVPRMHR